MKIVIREQVDAEVHEAQEEIVVLYIVHAAQNREGEF